MQEETTSMTPAEALALLLDQVDYTAGNCALTEMVGAVLPAEVIGLCRRVLAQHREEMSGKLK
jgi:hypothetical protein